LPSASVIDECPPWFAAVVVIEPPTNHLAPNGLRQQCGWL